jgi:sulfatase maturation enzyme AslB (radical SAM superfamily)
MTLALMGECNLRCRYCYQNAKSGARMPWPVIRVAAGRLLESQTGHVELVFAGGEPLLVFDLIERTVRYIERRRPAGLAVQYSLATNGTLLGAETIACLDRHRFDIELSFDGVLPAQAVRGKHSFARIDAALDRLRDNAPETFWRRLTVGVTLDAGAVPHLAESFSYFLDKRIPAVSMSPASGQGARWTPRVLDRLERELEAVYSTALRHYEDTGEVPLVPFRKTSSDAALGKEPVCGAADSTSVTIDTDGQAFACPMLNESSQRFANPRLAAVVQPMRMGGVSSPAFWERLAALPERARATGIFHVGPRRHSLHGQCIRCPYFRECKACPLAVLSEPAHDDAQRIPDYLCAFNWTLLGLRKKFPVQPDAAALLAGVARRPRLVRELLKETGAAPLI